MPDVFRSVKNRAKAVLPEKIYLPIWVRYDALRRRRILSRIKRLRSRYAGQRCFIMGNGPSLNDMQLDLFHNENMWCTNRAYLLFDRVRWRPRFYTAVDRRVVPDIAGELARLPGELPRCQFFFPLGFRGETELTDAANVYWFDERGVDEEQFPERVFSADCASYVVHPRTVTATAIQLAAYLGFNPLYLIGCDTNYSVPKTTVVAADNPMQLTSTQNDDPNHFDPRYFGQGKKWHAPHPERMIRHYEAIQQYATGNGLEIYNATVGGMLEVFPRVDYRDVVDG